MQTKNPNLYRELSSPFPSEAAAQAALEEFRKDLETIRSKNKICDIVAVIEVNALTEDGEDVPMTATVSFGDPLKKVILLAQSLGREQKILETSIATLLKPRK